MSFIVIEGLDGSGKSTQVKKLTNYFTDKGIACKFLHFPQLEKGIYGDLIARFLRGDMGDINNVDPYLVALIYAGDRKEAATMVQQWIDDGNMVIMDRYVYSNIAFQCAKLDTKEQKQQLAKWILNLEFEYHTIPKPDVNIFLDVPFTFTQKRLTETRTGEDREYLKGKQDIHEASLDFQKKVWEIYYWQVEQFDDFYAIDCKGNTNEMLTPDETFAKILKTINFIDELK